MDLTVVEALTIGDAWFQCLEKALVEGRTYRIQQGSFEGTHRKEIPLVAIIIRNPGVRPLRPDVPMGVPAPTTDEVIHDYMSYLMTGMAKLLRLVKMILPRSPGTTCSSSLRNSTMTSSSQI